MAYKKQRKICVLLRRKSLKKHLKIITGKGMKINKSSYKFIKPFITSKDFIGSNIINFVKNNKVSIE